MADESGEEIDGFGNCKALSLCGTALVQTVSFKPDLALPDLSVTSTLTLEGPPFSWGKNSLGNRGKI